MGVGYAMTIYRRQKLYEFYCPLCEYRVAFPDLHRADLESITHHSSGTHTAKAVTHEALEHVRGLAALYERFYA